MFLPQEALVAVETNSKEVKKHNLQVNTRIVFVDRSALVQRVVHLGSKLSCPCNYFLSDFFKSGNSLRNKLHLSSILQQTGFFSPGDVSLNLSVSKTIEVL